MNKIRHGLVAGLMSFIGILAVPTPASAMDRHPEDVYQQAIRLAAGGHDAEASAMLEGAAQMLGADDVWRERMRVASALLAMRRQRMHGNATLPPAFEPSIHARLIARYLKEHPQPEFEHAWLVGGLAALFPGAGHAMLGRWHDAATSAVLVWPMLLLTLWAWRRRMGPVTVFFALITVWLWSGTVFSAISLAHRGGIEQWLSWWQGLWRFSALPGRPW